MTASIVIYVCDAGEVTICQPLLSRIDIGTIYANRVHEN